MADSEIFRMNSNDHYLLSLKKIGKSCAGVLFCNFDELNFLGKNLTFKHSVKKLRGRRLAKIEGP